MHRTRHGSFPKCETSILSDQQPHKAETVQSSAVYASPKQQLDVIDTRSTTPNAKLKLELQLAAPATTEFGFTIEGLATARKLGWSVRQC
jgi:hypothetical protein